ncbi:helix-turn-helix domain-containing protein [Streptomyces sp. NPDC054863]
MGPVSDTGGTAELAESLRELKDRSGLSYGVLAKRLHMSTSTLHRYCNGDAVPTEFAPVERLARLCRATPDEMVRVHRLWILADAERGKRGAPAPEAEPVGPEPAQSAAVQPEPEPEPEPEPDPLVSLRSGDSGVPVASGASGRKRRRNVLIGVGTALAVAASAVWGTHLLGATGDEGSGGRAVGAVSSAGPSAGPTTDDGPAKSPSSAAPSGSAPGSPDRTGAPSPGSRGKGQEGQGQGQVQGQGQEQGESSGRGGGKSDGSTAVPFSAAVRPFVYETPCSQYFLVDAPPQRVAPPPGEQEAPGWAASYKAVSADDQLVALTLQGRSKETVVLEALHVRVVRSSAPLPWNRYAAGVGCGGNVDTKSFTVDLDAGRPVTAPHAGQRDFPYKISETDPEVFYVKARARAQDVTWYLELEWSSGGKRGIQRIDNHGTPFRTSGSAGRPEYVHPLGSTAWEKPLVDEPGTGP